MAESLEDFYVRLGLNMSELESGFVEANRTITENIGRLNRESNLIQIRSQVEIAGLDETTDAERILQIRTDALNQRMAIQRDRVRLVSAEVANLTREYGENHIVTQRATQRLEQTRLTLANMERELRNLTSPQNTESLVRFNAALSDIGDGLSEFLRADITSLIEAMPPQLKAVAAGMTAIGTGTSAAEKSVEALLEDFRELQNQAYELNMSVGKTRDFLRQLRLGGGDIGDFEGYIRGITDAFVKGEVDDPEFIALRKYGAEITDATGRLKDFKDLTEEVYQAWKKADEAGEGIEFLQLTGGESGIRDAIQFFKRYEEAVADAQKVMKAGIDDSQLHELDRVMKLVGEQAVELKNALGDIFVPAAQSAAESFFETLHRGTEFLVENKDEIQRWGFIAKEVFSTAGDKISGAFETAGKKIAEVNEILKGKTGDNRVDKILGDMSWRYGGTQRAYGIDKMISGQVEGSKKSLGVLDEFIKRGEQAQAEYNAEVSKTSELWQKVVETIKGGDKNPLNQYALQRVQQFKDELADLRIELDFDDEIEKARARLDQWFDKEFTRKNFLSDDEKEAIQELYSAKLEQIDRQGKARLEEANKRIQEYVRNAADIEFELTHSAFDKQLRDIELWKQAQAEKAESTKEAAAIGAEAVAKEAKAFEDEMERIKGTIQSLEDKIFEQEHSQYENDLRRIQQERLRLYENYQSKGILNKDTQALIERYYQNAVGKLNRRAAESQSKGGDYTKPPEGAMQRGGNGIVVIGGDQILDDGLIKAQQQQIALLTDENKIRAQLKSHLDKESREAVERIQAARNLTSAQKDLVQSAQQAAEGFTLIEGDKFSFMPVMAQDTSANQMLDFSTEEFDVKPLQDLKESVQSATDVQKEFAEKVRDFPPDYFKNLADGAKSVSEMQLKLTESTMDLIKAQDKLAQALSDLKVNPSKETSTDGVLKLSTLQVQELQPSPRREFSERSRDTGMKFGFDWDVASGVAGLGTLAVQLAQAVGAIAPHPAIKAGAMILGAGIGAGAGWGTWQETQAARELPDERLKAMPADVDLSPLETSLSGIGENVQSILQSIQAENEAKFAEYLSVMPKIGEDVQSILQSMQSAKEIPDMPALQMPEPPATLVDYLTPLNNIDGKLQSILQATQTQETISFETVVTPLNSINTLVGNILTALSNRQPSQITISPNNSINLGGAYVFDNALKKELVNDITSNVVDEITTAVQQAVSRTSYGYGV